MPLSTIPDDQKLAFDRALEQLQRYSAEVEPKLAMYCILLKQEDTIRKIIAIVSCIPSPPLLVTDLHYLEFRS